MIPEPQKSACSAKGSQLAYTLLRMRLGISKSNLARSLILLHHLPVLSIFCMSMATSWKALFKNIFCNILKFEEDEIHIPLGRSTRYDERKIPVTPQVLVKGRWLNAEIKCSHVNITHPHRPNL